MHRGNSSLKTHFYYLLSSLGITSPRVVEGDVHGRFSMIVRVYAHIMRIFCEFFAGFRESLLILLIKGRFTRKKNTNLRHCDTCRSPIRFGTAGHGVEASALPGLSPTLFPSAPLIVRRMPRLTVTRMMQMNFFFLSPSKGEYLHRVAIPRAHTHARFVHEFIIFPRVPSAATWRGGADLCPSPPFDRQRGGGTQSARHDYIARASCAFADIRSRELERRRRGATGTT